MNLKSHVQEITAAAIVAAGALFMPMPPAQAQTGGGMCAAVFPCDAEGNLLPACDSAASPCRESYLFQCLSLKQNLGKAILQRRVQELQKENAALRRRIKALQHRVGH